MIITSKTPSLDLHGESKIVSSILINEFITDNIKVGNHKVLIVHGKGTGTLKRLTHDLLKHDNRIERFYIDFFNDGATIVEIKK